MIVKYGGTRYVHANYENWFDFSYRFVHNQLGQKYLQINRCVLHGTLIGTSQAGITASIAALENAYSQDGFDLEVFHDNGTTLSRHYLYNANTLNGVRVKDLSWIPRDPRYGQSGPEYVNKRTYRIILESEKIDPNASALTSWHESLIGIGTGGSIFIEKGALQGPTQRQIIQQQSSYKAFQIGRAVGFLGYPSAIATPLFPNDEHVEQRQINPETPTFGANQNTQYPISWRYVFERSTPLAGSPSTF